MPHMHTPLNTKFLGKVCVWCFNVNFFCLWNFILLHHLFWGAGCWFACLDIHIVFFNFSWFLGSRMSPSGVFFLLILGKCFCKSVDIFVPVLKMIDQLIFPPISSPGLMVDTKTLSEKGDFWELCPKKSLLPPKSSFVPPTSYHFPTILPKSMEFPCSHSLSPQFHHENPE